MIKKLRRAMREKKLTEKYNGLINEITFQVMEGKTIEYILQSVCKSLAIIYQVDLVWVSFRNRVNSVCIKAYANPDSNYLESLTNRSELLSNPIYTDHIWQCGLGNFEFMPWYQRILHCGLPFSLAVPLITKEGDYGVIGFYSFRDNFCYKSLIKNLDRLSQQIAAILQFNLHGQQMQLLNIALESAANAVTIVDREKIIQWVNPAFCQISGYSQEEIIGKNLNILRSNLNDIALYQKIWSTLANGDVWKGELIYQRKNEELYIAGMTVTPVKDDDGKIISVIIIMQDITRKKQIVEQLERYKLISKEISEIILMISLDGKFLEVNNGAIESSGYSQKELLNMKIEDLLVGDSIFTAYGYSISNTIPKNRPFEILMRCKDGSIFPVEVNIVVSKIGEQMVLLCIGRDVTKRKQAERRLLEANKKMAKAKRLSSLAVMAAGIAHEINQPLNSIKVIADSMLYWSRKGEALDNHEIMESIQQISQQAERIKETIKEIRETVGRQNSSQLVPCNLNQIIDSVLAVMEKQIENQEIHIVKKIEDDLPWILGTVGRLEEVILNLLSNSIQALELTKEGKKEIVITTWSEDKVFLEVKDNGPGIGEHIKSKILNPFVTTKTVGENMGMGLSIVNSIVISCGGKISFTNNDQGGATFQISFPFIK